MDNYGITDRLCEMDESDLSNMLLMEAAVEMMDQQQQLEDGEQEINVDDTFDDAKLDLVSFLFNVSLKFNHLDKHNINL